MSKSRARAAVKESSASEALPGPSEAAPSPPPAPSRPALRTFAWGRLSSWGDSRIADGRVESPIYAPDYAEGDEPKARDGYDRFGWMHASGRLLTEPRRLTRLHNCSVLRSSLGRERWHVVSADGSQCASDSYHDGEWIGPHVGDTVTLDVGGSPLTANVRDAAPLDFEVYEPAVLIDHLWSGNYAHALLETASRFWYIERHAEIAHLPCAWETAAPWQREIAEWLCHGRATPLPGRHVRFRTLYVPSFYSQIGCSMESVAWLRKRFAAPSQPGTKRLLVSRSDASTRRIVNEAEVEKALAPLGFERVRLAGLTVAAQRDLFAEAEVVVAPHGAALANLIFAGVGTKVVEIVPRSYPHHIYQHVAKWSGHWYGRLVVEDRQNEDMHVEPAAILRALESGEVH